MRRVRKTSFYPKGDKGIQAVWECINNVSTDCFNIFSNKKGLIGKS